MGHAKPILVVEDDHDVRDAMVEVLQAEGYDAVAAGDGKQALEQLQAGLEPCLIVLDLMMPVMDGWKFMEQHEVRDSNAPIVVVSAYGSADAVRSAGVAAYMHKPVDVDDLLGVIARHCGGPRA